MPASAEPSRVQNQLAPMNAPPVAAGPSAAAGVPAVNAPEGADQITLVLKNIIIDNMTVYKPAEVAPLYQKLLGTQVTLTEVYGIAAALTAKYRNDGYILTQVVLPPQEIEDGAVRLKVVEGYVDRVMIKGRAHGNRAYIKAMGEKIRQTRPLTEKALERYMLLINDLPGISARAVLEPAQAPGASDVTIVLDERQVSVFVETDNRGSRYIGPMQVTGGAQINNAFGHFESISLQAAAAPDGWPRRELTFGSASWMQPIGREGTKLTVSGSISATHPGFTLSPFDVTGIARALSLQVQHPFVRTRGLTVTGSAKFDYLNSFRNDNLGLPATVDHVRAVRVGGTLQTSDRLGGADTVNIEASQGLGLLGASQEGDANMTHPNANPQFFKVTGEFTRAQPIKGPVSLFTSVTAQAASSQLLASEQFGVGGAAYGSAYDSSEITGDDGVAARVEVRADNPVHTSLKQFQPYMFYDIGQVWDPGNSVVDDRIRSVASAGLGFRAVITDKLSASFEASKPLTRPVATENNNDIRLFGSLTLRY